MAHKIQSSQTDFSSGEVDASLKRADQNPHRKAGLRQAKNVRMRNGGGMQDRPGRTALFFETGRVEDILITTGVIFKFAFGNNYLSIYSAAGTLVFQTFVKGDGATPIPWTLASVGQITWAVIGFSVYIAEGADVTNNVPQVLTWGGGTNWVISTYAESVTAGGQKRTFFDRISPPNITLQPGGITGSVPITFSAPVLVAGMVGTRLLYCGRQLTITTVTSPTTGGATINEQLFGSESIPVSSSPIGSFNIGDVVNGSISGGQGIVIGLTSTTVSVQLIKNTSFVATDIIAGPQGSAAASGGATAGNPGAVADWDDEVMNGFRGYPLSVASDQNRLIFSNFPALRGAIGWSAIGLPTDLFVSSSDTGLLPSSAMLEIAPGKSQVLYVIPGMESSEFLFCDNAIYFIPISVQSPLVPGGVQFIELAAHGSQPNVQPRRTEQTIIYMKAAGIGVGAVQAPGATNRPYIVDSVSDFHGHLFKGRGVKAIAIPTASTQFEETYIYICFNDGTLVVGKYSMKSGLLEAASDGKTTIGWVPWNSAGNLLWASALQSVVTLTSTYNIPGAAPQSIVEQLDDTQYLDGAVLVNSLPVPLQPTGGKGPLWWLAGGSVTLMDGTPQPTRMMGTYQIDANGFIIPQGNAAENLTSGALVAGQPWTMVVEPFAPIAQSGIDVFQRMSLRQISEIAVWVINSTGFVFQSLFSAKQTATTPPLGTPMQYRRVQAWDLGDDPTQTPQLQETVETWTPPGSSYDPRVAIIKDTPGPLQILEIGIEVTL